MPASRLKLVAVLLLAAVIDPVSSIPIQKQFVAGPPLTEEEFNSPPVLLSSGNNKPNPLLLADLYEGDIKLKESENRTSGLASGILGSQYRWPNAQIPYQISADYTESERQAIASGMNELQKVSCIRFVPQTTEGDNIIIQKTGGGCYSYVGRQGGSQIVSLDDGCMATYIVQHELMHAAGFFHEQSRYDRDDYVTVYFDNIPPDRALNFEKAPRELTQLFGTLYNFKSIMHYSSFDFAINTSKPTITAIDGSLTGGFAFTQEDITKLNRMYNCNPSDCWDDDPRTDYCSGPVAAGECNSNTAEMTLRCTKSCGTCSPTPTTSTARPPTKFASSIIAWSWIQSVFNNMFRN